jgi:hypothetical protein
MKIAQDVIQFAILGKDEAKFKIIADTIDFYN